MSAEIKITDRSFDFAVRVVKLCRFLEGQDRVSKKSEIVPDAQLSEIIKEADEIIRILTAIAITSQTRSASGTNAKG